MSKMVVVFTNRARKRLLEILDYLYQQNLSNDFAINYSVLKCNGLIKGHAGRLVK